MAEEKNFETRIKRYLDSKQIFRLGCTHQNGKGYWVKRHGGSQFVARGLPDMQIVIGFVCLEVEIKAEDGRVSALQKMKLHQINSSGGLAIVLYPHEFDEFKELIEGILEWTANERTVAQFASIAQRLGAQTKK